MNRVKASPHKNLIAICAICMISLILSSEIHAGLVAYQPHSWSSDSLRIVRDGQTLVPSAPSTIADFVGGMDYTYSQDAFQEVAIAHTGFSVSKPEESNEAKVYQHIYAYSIPEGVSVRYHAANTAGHQASYLYDASHYQTMSASSSSLPKSFKIVGNLDLNGSLLLAKSDLQGEDGYKGLLASFNVLVNKLTPDGEGGYKTQKVLKGTVELVGKKNGDVKIRTKGAIHKSDISLITETDDSFQIDFIEEAIPYKLKAKLEEEYILDTTVYSFVDIQGSGTGAEVMFTPGSLAIPSIQQTGQFPVADPVESPVEGNSNEVPEPGTLLLFLSGLCSMRILRNSRSRLTDNQ